MIIRSFVRAGRVFKLFLEMSLSKISFQAQTLPVLQATALDSSCDRRVWGFRHRQKLNMILVVGKLHLLFS